MSDVTFNCPLCKQSLEAPSDMVGQIIDCPSCNKKIKVSPQPPVPRGKFKLPPPRQPLTMRPPLPTPPVVAPTTPVAASAVDKKCPSCAETVKAEAKVCRFCGFDFVTATPRGSISASASARTSQPLSKILTVLVIIAIMVGGFFAYNFWKDQQRAKTEAPFFLAAKEALDEAHKVQSAVGMGLSYQKYGDLLIAMAPKVDNLLRAAIDTGIENLKPDARVFCTHIIAARDSYKGAMGWWDNKIRYPESDSIKEYEKSLQDAWTAASTAVDEAGKVYATLNR